MKALRPPVEECGGAHYLGLGLQRDTVLGLRFFEVLDGGEMAVDQRGVGQRPQMLGRLEFWRVGREEVQIDVVRHAQAQTGMPARSIQDHDELLLRSRACLARKGGELGFKEWDTH